MPPSPVGFHQELPGGDHGDEGRRALLLIDFPPYVVQLKKSFSSFHPIPPVSAAEQSSGVICQVPLFSSLQRAPARPNCISFSPSESERTFFFLEDLFYPDDKKSPQMICNTLTLDPRRLL